MNLPVALVLIVLVGIFHVFGGAMFGQGIRALRDNREHARSLLVSGAMFGIVPILFDFVMFAAQKMIVWSFIGPALFIFATVVSAFVWEGPFEEIDSKALLSFGMGSGALLLGIFGGIFLFNNMQSYQVGVVDYIMGGVWTCMFVGIGGSFAWLGLSAILHRRTMDEENKIRASGVKQTNPKKSNE